MAARPYRKEMKISNLKSLPRGLGARFLIGVESYMGSTLIAKRWAHKMSDEQIEQSESVGEIVIDFGNKEESER